MLGISDRSVRRMDNKIKVVGIIFFCSLFGIIYKFVKVVDGHNEAFVHTDGVFRHLGDDIPLSMYEFFNVENAFTSRPLLFNSPSLNLKTCSVGMPFMDTTLFLISLSGSIVHFYSSFIQEKVTNLCRNDSFSRFILAREECPAKNKLFVPTSVGAFKYQLTEMYSFRTVLHLELLTDEAESSKYVWKCSPYETKPMMQAYFVSRIESNHILCTQLNANNNKQEDVITPMEIGSGFNIGEISCSGLRVLNSYGFEMKLICDQKLYLGFISDFSLSQVVRTLNIHTSLGIGGLVLQYTLGATLPHSGHSLPRPTWELLLYYLFLSVTWLVLTVLMAIAYFEGENLMKAFSVIITALAIEKDSNSKKFAITFFLNHVGSALGYKPNKTEVIDSPSHFILEGNGRYENSFKNNSRLETWSNCTLHHSYPKRNRKCNFSTERELCKVTSAVKYENEGNHFKQRSPQHKQRMEETFKENGGVLKTNKKTRIQVRCSDNLIKHYSSCKPEEKVGTTQTTKGINLERSTQKTQIDSDFRYYENKLNCKFVNVHSNSILRQNSCMKNSHEKSNSKLKNKTNILCVENELSSTSTKLEISEKDNCLLDISVVTRQEKMSGNKRKTKDKPSRKANLGYTPEIFGCVKDKNNFQISTKNTKCKNIKASSKVFEKDVLDSSTLELRYKPKHAVTSKGNKQKKWQSEMKTNKIPCNIKPTNHSVATFTDTCSKNHGNESSPPVWNNSQASSKHGSYQPLTYSAVVSGDLGSNKTKYKVASTGNFGKVSSCISGSIGQKSSVISNSSSESFVNCSSSSSSPNNQWSDFDRMSSSLREQHLSQEKLITGSFLQLSHIEGKLEYGTSTSEAYLDALSDKADWAMCVSPISKGLWDPALAPVLDMWQSVVTSDEETDSSTLQTNEYPKASSHFWSSVVDSSRNSLSSIWPTANSSTFAEPLLNLDNANLNTTERDQEVFEESGFVEVPMPPSITSTLSTDSFNLFQTFDIWNPPLIASDISSPSSLDVWSNFSVFS
ncbi:uncharacterized protein LOC143230780 isoform X3 [Tachypleus tridentatus]|uniref:uncharacterized protein LOC143230780 isoform X3 n=1 Tax=Tachypleus tridentatus TaxID=6853 RepID=UPI003FCF347A